jgi:hypothetical protein
MAKSRRSEPANSASVKIKLVAKISLLTALGVVTLTCCVPAQAETRIVKTAAGRVHGKLINNGKVSAYQGIPYAAPPVGKLRWQAPQPVLGWNSVLDATTYGLRRGREALGRRFWRRSVHRLWDLEVDGDRPANRQQKYLPLQIRPRSAAYQVPLGFASFSL